MFRKKGSRKSKLKFNLDPNSEFNALMQERRNSRLSCINPLSNVHSRQYDYVRDYSSIFSYPKVDIRVITFIVCNIELGALSSNLITWSLICLQTGPLPSSDWCNMNSKDLEPIKYNWEWKWKYLWCNKLAMFFRKVFTMATVLFEWKRKIADTMNPLHRITVFLQNIYKRPSRAGP